MFIINNKKIIIKAKDCSWYNFRLLLSSVHTELTEIYSILLQQKTLKIINYSEADFYKMYLYLNIKISWSVLSP